MKNPTLLFFSDKSEEAILLEEELKRANIPLVSVKSYNDLIRAFNRRRISVLLMYENAEFIGVNNLVNLSVLTSFHYLPNILVIGNPLLIDLSIDTHIGLVIDRSLEMEEKLNEIYNTWEAELLLFKEEERFNKLRRDDNYSERLEEDLEEKKRQLSALYMEQVEVRKQLSLLYEQWMTLDVRQESEAHTKFHHALKRLANATDTHSHTMERFIEVEQDFLNKLKGQSRELTEDNRKMCIYLRMGISNKEIAELMNIQYNSVKKAQNRLKQLLNVSKEISLRKFIQAL